MAKRKLTSIQGVNVRAPTGPLRIGADWPGVFLRGDEAASWTKALKLAVNTLSKQATVTEDSDLDSAARELRKLSQLLSSAMIKGAQRDLIARERDLAMSQPR